MIEDGSIWHHRRAATATVEEAGNLLTLGKPPTSDYGSTLTVSERGGSML
jgi:hypothetical protein